ncbi:MAG: hypothetical protein AB2806_15975, partial [Candidatus Thiodiazotropha sp.]
LDRHVLSVNAVSGIHPFGILAANEGEALFIFRMDHCAANDGVCYRRAKVTDVFGSGTSLKSLTR